MLKTTYDRLNKLKIVIRKVVGINHIARTLQLRATSFLESIDKVGKMVELPC